MLQKIRNNAFVKNSSILFAGTMLGSVLNYIFHLVIGRLVSIEIYGEIESITSLINIISVPAMTLMMITMKYSAGTKAEDDKEGCYKIIKYLSKKVLFYGLPIFVFTLVVTPIISDFLKIESSIPFIMVWLFMFLSFFYSINQGALQGWQKFMAVSWVGVWGAFIKLVIGVGLVWAGFGLNGAIGGFALGAVASYIASVITLKFIIKKEHCKFTSVDRVTFQSIKKYVLPVFIGNLAINILGNADMVLAKHNLDSLAAGQYGALTIVSKIIFFATGVIATVLFSMSAENSHKKNNTIIIFRNAAYFMLFVSISAVIIYFAFPNLVFGMLFGSKYFAVSSYLGWFAVMVTLFSFVNLIFQYLLSIHETKVVYSLLAISIIASTAILFLGKSISDILWIVTIAQAISIMAGLFYLFNKKKEEVSK